MPGAVLHGGRYDGMTFVGSDGFVPGPEIGVIYLGTAAHDKSAPLPSTAACSIPFGARKTHDPFDSRWHRTEVYVRCPDGSYRTPKLAAAVL